MAKTSKTAKMAKNGQKRLKTAKNDWKVPQNLTTSNLEDPKSQ